MLNTLQLYIFDLDGTLVNSEGAIKPAFDAALSACDFPPMDNAWFTKQVGTPLMEILEEHLTPEQYASLDDTEFIPVLRETFYELVDEHTHLLPSVIETLEQLKQAGKQLAVATNKPAHQAEVVLKSASIDHLIDFAAGIITEDPTTMKPHPDMINRVLAHFNMQPNQAVMVGDTWRDIAAGKAAGTATVGITTGAGTREELAEHAPTQLIDQLAELLA